ncbi:MAG: hypothetical protein J1F25_00655 [Prevotellaceae bacterium]|nr:hypothetical protein [Prevotellaceae bacterium]
MVETFRRQEKNYGQPFLEESVATSGKIRRSHPGTLLHTRRAFSAHFCRKIGNRVDDSQKKRIFASTIMPTLRGEP